MKKLISVILCFMLTMTLIINKPAEVKAEVDLRQSLIATLVIALINMGVHVTSDIIEPYIVKWAINADDYKEELENQFNNVKNALILGFKTLTLTKRILRDLTNQGLKNNSSITITTGDFPSVNYTKGTWNLYNAVLTADRYSASVTYNAQDFTDSPTIANVSAYYIIPLQEGKNTVYFPTLDITMNKHVANYACYRILFEDENSLNTYVDKLNKQEFHPDGGYGLPSDSTKSNFGYIDYWDLTNPKVKLTTTEINNQSISYENKNWDTYYKYALILELLEFNYPSAAGITKSAQWTINVPENNSAINMSTTTEQTVTADIIDNANWSAVNSNYTYEMIIQSNNQVVTSNQALIDAVNSNTQTITQSQVIDTTTLENVEDIKTNVWGISTILEGIKTSIQTLVKPITDVFNKTYTLEEINTLSWVNVMNDLVTTIETGVGNILPYYQNNVGQYLQQISHPEANLLTVTVNDILVNTNLQWAVYAISVLLLVKGVIL